MAAEAVRPLIASTMVALWALGVLVTIGRVGVPRAPLSSGDAGATFIGATLMAAGVLYLYAT